MSAGKVQERENDGGDAEPVRRLPAADLRSPADRAGPRQRRQTVSRADRESLRQPLSQFHSGAMDDQAVLDIGGARLAFTTDSFVVTPIFFPGGDIGTLAVNGTVNDLAMGGAKPLYLSAAFILEEGLPADGSGARGRLDGARPRKAPGCSSSPATRRSSNRGKGDKIFITTTGIGVVDRGTQLSADRARPGDKILLSGHIGDHGITILSQREGLEFESALESDCAALHGLVAAMLRRGGRRRGIPRDARSDARRRRHGAERNRRPVARGDGAARRARFRCATQCAAPAKCWGSIRSMSPTRASWSPLSRRRSRSAFSRPCRSIRWARRAAIIGEVVEQPRGHGADEDRVSAERASSTCFSANNCRASADSQPVLTACSSPGQDSDVNVDIGNPAALKKLSGITPIHP